MKCKIWIIAILMLIGLLTPNKKAQALTGVGLPSGCHGGEVFINYGAPDSWGWVVDTAGPHLAVYYTISTSYGAYDLCWASFHGTMNTDAYSGGSDSWSTELKDGRLMVLIPKTLYAKYIARGYTTSAFVGQFYLYTYWER